MLRINYFYHGAEHHFERADPQEIIIGRKRRGHKVDLDLAPDMLVSSRHARIWTEDDAYWLEDLDSEWGTKLDGQEIRGRGKQPLQDGDVVKIGNWLLFVHVPAQQAATVDYHPNQVEQLAAAAISLNAHAPALVVDDSSNLTLPGRALLFYELPLQFSAQTRKRELLQLIAGQTLKAVPGAQRSAIFLNKQTGGLVLRAHAPAEHTAASHTLAERAAALGQAFIWPPPTGPAQHGSAQTGLKHSAPAAPVSSAMYAPLAWKGEVLGVLYAERSAGAAAGFELSALQLMQALAHHAAMALAQLQREEALREQQELQHNFLKLVSPQIAEHLQQTHRRLHLGGEFRHATILLSDIRGFTNLSATMSPIDVTEMLDDYFGRLVPIIFKYRGAVDKYVGDAILAVFGSPEPDEQQHIHAVRAAVAMQAAMHEVNEQRQAQGKHTSELGIGVHCGEVVHGLIGTTRRMEFTVIGDAVNRASRYCDGAHAGEVLLSPEVYHHVAQHVEVTETSVQTKHEGELLAYHVTRIKGSK